MVNVQQQGDDQLDADSQVIIPMSNTSCSGRITGFMMSLSQEQNSSDYLRLEVWSPTNILSEVYEMIAEYVLAEHDIKDMGKYHFANVSFAENETIKFEKGSFIGIYLPPNPQYTVWSINTTENANRRIIPRMDLNITRASNVYTMVNDSQPLIQVVFGKLIISVISM